MTDPTSEEIRLFELLATGVTDEVAARQLGLHPRSFQRRLRSGMAKMGASSRFQAGFLFATSDWLELPPRGARE